MNRHHKNSRIIMIRAAAAAAVLVTLCMIIFSSGKAIHATEDEKACKMYTSIQLEKGDTLWSIAEQYMDGHYSSIREYIDEVKFINELTSDVIHADAYLVVPYYSA